MGLRAWIVYLVVPLVMPNFLDSGVLSALMLLSDHDQQRGDKAVSEIVILGLLSLSFYFEFNLILSATFFLSI